MKGPGYAGLRPTADRVRESLFNILGPRVQGARVLDLFAGTGALGIEALSRGAAKAVFVERDRRALALLRANLTALGLGPGRAEVIARPVEEGLPALIAGGERFELVLADPPYAAGIGPSLLALLIWGGLVARGGMVVVEHRACEEPPVPAELVPSMRRVYGETAVSFLIPREEPTNA